MDTFRPEFVGELDSVTTAVVERMRGGVSPLTQPIVDAARKQRVSLLLAASLGPDERATPQASQLLRDLTIAVALDAWREEEVRGLIASLGRASIGALLLKGTGLAYIVYAQPHLRPRVDIDVLIRRSTRSAAEQVLAAEGWVRPLERHEEVVESQHHYLKETSAGQIYHVDLHWKIANPHVFADTLSFDELDARAIPVARLGPFARTLGMLDALILACIHRVAHHGDSIDLLWLWDVHLLTERLSPDDRRELLTRAEQLSMSSVCGRSIDLAVRLFGTREAGDLARHLIERGLAAREPSARFLGGASTLTTFRSDFGTLTGLDKWSLVREHLFPSVAYMRQRYRGLPFFLLPMAYVHRAVSGAPKWFRRPR